MVQSGGIHEALVCLLRTHDTALLSTVLVTLMTLAEHAGVAVAVAALNCMDVLLRILEDYDVRFGLLAVDLLHALCRYKVIAAHACPSSTRVGGVRRESCDAGKKPEGWGLSGETGASVRARAAYRPSAASIRMLFVTRSSTPAVPLQGVFLFVCERRQRRAHPCARSFGLPACKRPD